jgi:hypothetical protein
MAKAGQHHNDGLSSSKPRGHEKSRGRNKPERSEPIMTGPPKKKKTYAKQANEGSARTADSRPRSAEFNPWNEDIRDQPDTTSGSTRARDTSLHGRSGSDSNADSGTRGH